MALCCVLVDPELSIHDVTHGLIKVDSSDYL